MMKRIVLFATLLLALIGCQREMPTLSPSQATLYVGDTLQLTITNMDDPYWIVGCDLEDRKDSAKFVKIVPINQVVARKAGKISLGFQYYKPNTLGQQVFFIFTKLNLLDLPTIIPNMYIMNVGDTLPLLVQGIDNPTWELEYPLGKPESDIIQLTDSNQVVALKTGVVNLGFHYDSQSAVGPAVRSAFTKITIK